MELFRVKLSSVYIGRISSPELGFLLFRVGAGSSSWGS